MHAFIFGDLLSQGFCGSFHLLGIHRHTSQFRQQLATFLETDHRSDGAGHACEGRRERTVFESQLLIARTEALAAGRAVIVGALQAQGTQHTKEDLPPASGIARFLSTATTNSRTSLIAGISIEPLLDGHSSQLQGALSH